MDNSKLHSYDYIDTISARMFKIGSSCCDKNWRYPELSENVYNYLSDEETYTRICADLNSHLH